MAAATLKRETTATRVADMLSRRPIRIHIAVNGVWSADLAGLFGEGDSCMFSYEKLDYHSGTREFLEGLRDAGIPFVFHGDKRL